MPNYTASCACDNLKRDCMRAIPARRKGALSVCNLHSSKTYPHYSCPQHSLTSGVAYKSFTLCRQGMPFFSAVFCMTCLAMIFMTLYRGLKPIAALTSFDKIASPAQCDGL